MARYAFRRRYSGRRNRSRGRGRLSTRNIFNNKGAKAQAAQIQSLKRRINSVYRQCKPEIKTIESEPSTFTLEYNPNTGRAYHLYQVTMPELGVEDDARVGNACNILDSHIFMNMRIAWKGNPSYSLNNIGQLTNSTIRIVPFIVKSAMEYQPDPEDILTMSVASSSAAGYRMNPIVPFNEGVSSKYQILGDYRYTLRFDDKATINTKLKIKGSRIRKYMATQYYSVGKAAIYVLMTWNGLDPITFENETIAIPAAYITIQDKTAYTDP